MRPTDYSDDILLKAAEYVQCFLDDESRAELSPPQVIPSHVGLFRYIGIGKTTGYRWKDEEGKEQFRDILEECLDLQHIMLVNTGLVGGFNPVVTKMILTKHGYSDKIEQQHTSPDGSMSPTRIEVVAGDNSES